MENKRIIIGIDILPQSSSVKSPPKFAVVVLRDDSVIDRKPAITKYRLVKLIKTLNADILAVDNIYELAPTSEALVSFLVRLPSTMKLIQVTGSPHPSHGMEPLNRVANRYGIPISGKGALEEAEVSARLAVKNVGYIASLFEEETEIYVTRARSLGSGGWSQDRFHRRISALIQSATKEIRDRLESASLDYDITIKDSAYGLDRAVFTVYTSQDKLYGIIKKTKGPDIQIKINPVKRKRIEFIPLGITDFPVQPTVTKTKKLIVGIDPGVTVGIAILDLRGEVIFLDSAKGLSRGDVIRRISEYGTATIIATDVTTIPTFIQTLSTKFNSRIHSATKILTVSEKNDMVRALNDLNGTKPSNSHERDALVAAINAFSSYKNVFDRIEVTIKKTDIKAPVSRTFIDNVKSLVVQEDIPIKDAIDRLIQEEKEEIVIEEATKVILTPEQIEAKTSELRAKIKLQEEQLDNFKTQNELYSSKISELESIITDLQEKIKSLLSEERTELKKLREIKSRDEEIGRLRKQEIDFKNEISQLRSKFSDLKRLKLIEIRGNSVPLRIIETFSEEGINRAKEEFGIKKGDVCLLLDPSGGSKSTAEILISFEIKAIITEVEKMSHIAEARFLESEIPLIARNGLKTLKNVDEFAIIDKNELDEKIVEWEKWYNQLLKEKTQDMLQKIIKEYRKQKVEEMNGVVQEDSSRD
jgi:predicted RNase H-like nuclease (RuvC/YqgF family)